MAKSKKIKEKQKKKRVEKNKQYRERMTRIKSTIQARKEINQKIKEFEEIVDGCESIINILPEKKKEYVQTLDEYKELKTTLDTSRSILTKISSLMNESQDDDSFILNSTLLNIELSSMLLQQTIILDNLQEIGNKIADIETIASPNITATEETLPNSEFIVDNENEVNTEDVTDNVQKANSLDYKYIKNMVNDNNQEECSNIRIEDSDNSISMLDYLSIKKDV